MKNKYLLPLGIALSLLLSGCGSNGSNSDSNKTTETNQEHSNENSISVHLSGKTFYYLGGEDNAPRIETIVFNSDLSSFTSTEDDAPTVTTLNGNQLNLPKNESFSIKEVTDDYIVINFSENGEDSDTFRLYSDKSKAEAYLEAFNKILATLIVGTTQYTINSNGVLSDKVLKEDGVFTENVTLANSKNFDTVGTYNIKNNVVTLTRDTGMVFVVVYLAHNSEYITLSASLNGGEVFETYWFSTAEARDTKGVKLISK